jgi:excisionase family DNA binding protein
MAENQKTTYTLAEVAQILSVHTDTIRAMVKEGSLPVIKVRSGPRKTLLRIRRASLDKFMHDHEIRKPRK